MYIVDLGILLGCLTLCSVEHHFSLVMELSVLLTLTLTPTLMPLLVTAHQKKPTKHTALQ